MKPDENNISPDANLRNKPPVNMIGGAVDTQNSPALNRINSAARPTDKTVEIYPPGGGGSPEFHTMANARDLMRHHGWTLAPVKASKSEADEEPKKAEENNDSETVAAANMRLEAFRDVLKAMGVTIDQRWGIRRLTEEITNRGGIIPV